MQATSSVDEMSGSELLDHVELLGLQQRKAGVAILVAAQQHAVRHNPDTLDPAISKLNGRERPKRFGGTARRRWPSSLPRTSAPGSASPRTRPAS